MWESPRALGLQWAQELTSPLGESHPRRRHSESEQPAQRFPLLRRSPWHSRCLSASGPFEERCRSETMRHKRRSCRLRPRRHPARTYASPVLHLLPLVSALILLQWLTSANNQRSGPSKRMHPLLDTLFCASSKGCLIFDRYANSNDPARGSRFRSFIGSERSREIERPGQRRTSLRTIQNEPVYNRIDAGRESSVRPAYNRIV